MSAADIARFAAGIVFAGAGLYVLLVARGEQGFGQRRQLAVFLLAGGGLLLAVGLGLVKF